MSLRRSVRPRALLPLVGALAVLLAGPAQAGGPNSGANSALIQPDGRIVAAGWGETASWGAAGVFGLARYMPDGSLDKSFGSGGQMATPSGSSGAVALQADGRLVAAGSDRGKFVLVRYTRSGSRDKTFASGGQVTTTFGSLLAQAAAVAIQADGKIVVAGAAWAGSLTGQEAGFALARYNPNGSLDTAFGTDGRVTTTVDGGGGAYALAIQPDGKLVAAGSVGTPLLHGNKFAVARYAPDGSLDAAFGTGGVVTSAFGLLGAEARAVALQPDGKIVVAGTGLASVSAPPEVVIARYAPDGSLDASFGTNGVATTPYPATGQCDQCGLYANAVAIQADGRIVAAGQSCLGPCTFALERYKADGSLDTGFGSGGEVTTSSGISDSCSGSGGDYARAVGLQADGKIVAAGYTNFGSCSPDYYRFALARYAPDGSLDNSFGKTGFVNTSVAACLVPMLHDEALSWAKQALTRGHCALGKVSRIASRTVGKGHIVSQSPMPCVLREPQTKVGVTVSKGSRGGRAPRAAPHPGAIVYDSRTHLGCSGGGSGPSHLFAIRPNGAGLVELTHKGNTVRPDWSPDGREIAFTAQPGGGVLLMNANGSHVRVVVPAPAGNPAFSPDGKRIAFVRRSSCRLCDSSGVIWTMRRNGKEKHKIVADGHDPDWSPDGKQIVFVAHNLNLYTVGANGGRPNAVTHGGNAVLPVWSPNGRQIAFVLADESGWKLAVVDVADGSTRVIGQDINENTRPAWSPDGTRIAYDRYGSIGEQLVTVRATGGGVRVVTTMIGGPSGISWRR